MFNLYNARASHFMPLTAVITMTVFRLFGFANVGGNGGVFLMGFFSSAIDGLKTVITAIGAGIGVWGVINLLEGYGNDNAGSKSQGIKHFIPNWVEQNTVKGQSTTQIAKRNDNVIAFA